MVDTLVATAGTSVKRLRESFLPDEIAAKL
jgi:hypothetical protein